MKRNKKEKKLLDNWRVECESALLYRAAAETSRSERYRRTFLRLATFEEAHVKLWEEILREKGVLLRARSGVFMWLMKMGIRFCSPSLVVSLLEWRKHAKIHHYFNQIDEECTHELTDKLKKVLHAEKEHAAVLSYLSGKPLSAFNASGWHTGDTSIRDVVFGMNDGLLSTFSLIAGLAGGDATSAVILLAGVAAAVAGAISMAAGAYVSVKAEKEVLEKQLAIEKKELAIMPEGEKMELVNLYHQKGIDREQAEAIADIIMSNKDVALETMAREELGFAPSQVGNPLRAALFSGIAFGLGSCIPIMPFCFFSHPVAIMLAIIFSLSGFFIIGAVRTLVTGKKALFSGLEMFCIGTAAALITYFIGRALGRIIGM